MIQDLVEQFILGRLYEMWASEGYRHLPFEQQDAIWLLLFKRPIFCPARRLIR